MLGRRTEKKLAPGAVEVAMEKLGQAERLVGEARRLLSGEDEPDPSDLPVLSVLVGKPGKWMSVVEVVAETSFSMKAEAAAMALLRLHRRGAVRRRQGARGSAKGFQYMYPRPRETAGTLSSDDPAVCEHPNEAPCSCPCKPGCYCKTRTCRGT